MQIQNGFILSAFILVPFFVNTNAFVPSVKPDVKTFTYFGDIQPVGYFDPCSLTSEQKDEEIKYVREAELQHGRVAMTAFVGLVTLDLVQDKLAIDCLSSLTWEEQFPYWFGVAAFEFTRMGAGWTNPFTKSGKYFKLEEDYQPGNVFKMDVDSIPDRKYNVELSNGRLAMLGCLGYIAEEFVTRVPIF